MPESSKDTSDLERIERRRNQRIERIKRRQRQSEKHRPDATKGRQSGHCVFADHSHLSGLQLSQDFFGHSRAGHLLTIDVVQVENSLYSKHCQCILIWSHKIVIWSIFVRLFPFLNRCRYFHVGVTNVTCILWPHLKCFQILNVIVWKLINAFCFDFFSEMLEWVPLVFGPSSCSTSHTFCW